MNPTASNCLFTASHKCRSRRCSGSRSHPESGAGSRACEGLAIGAEPFAVAYAQQLPYGRMSEPKELEPFSAATTMSEDPRHSFSSRELPGAGPALARHLCCMPHESSSPPNSLGSSDHHCRIDAPLKTAQRRSADFAGATITMFARRGPSDCRLQDTIGGLIGAIAKWQLLARRTHGLTSVLLAPLFPLAGLRPKAAFLIDNCETFSLMIKTPIGHSTPTRRAYLAVTCT